MQPIDTAFEEEAVRRFTNGGTRALAAPSAGTRSTTPRVGRTPDRLAAAFMNSSHISLTN